MPEPAPHYATVAENVLLDSRLALFHQTQRWLVVADVHFGYELSQRAAGRLVPMWGMASVRQRLLELLADHKPERLIILGDLVHDRQSRAEAEQLIATLSHAAETIVVAGNHDRGLGGIRLHPSWDTDGFRFHHGHREIVTDGRTLVIGHHHPAGVLSDRAGLRLKYPAFVQRTGCWIMPAFSPWAAGSTWRQDDGSRIWLCSPGRILPLGVAQDAA